MAKPTQNRKPKNQRAVQTEKTSTATSILSSISQSKLPIASRKIYIIALIIGLLLLVYYKKSWFVAATVNGSPLSNFELLSRLNKQYRTTMLNQMINEKIIVDEARKNKIALSGAEIDKKISELEVRVGGTQALDSMLSQQGQTRESLKDQMRIQLIVEKLFAKESTVSAQEISNFIAQNKATLQATESAEQEKEASEILKQQKLGDAFQTKFQELKQQTQVKIF